jgi:hypothetical protein
MKHALVGPGFRLAARLFPYRRGAKIGGLHRPVAAIMGDVTKLSPHPTLSAAAPVRAARQQRVAAGRSVHPPAS